MHIFVTGATGFIGRRLVARAMAAGHQVSAISRRSDHELACNAIVADPLDVDSYSAMMRLRGVEAIINLLAAGVEPSDRDVDSLMAANACFPTRLALAGARAGVSAFVQIGSSAEYAGGRNSVPIAESDALESVRLYGATKAAGSLLLRSTANHIGLPAAVLRAFNVFGPGEKPHRLFPAVATRLSRGEAVDLSVGTQVRDFLYVDDVCEAILRMTHSLLSQTAEPGEYNLGSGQPVTVRAFVTALSHILGADEGLLRFGALPLRPDDLSYVVASTTKLDHAIGSARRLSLGDALMQAVRELRLEVTV